MAFDFGEYQLELAVQRRAQELNLSWAGVVFDPSKHPRLGGKFTFAGTVADKPGGAKVYRPTKPHNIIHSVVVSPSKTANHSYVSILRRSGHIEKGGMMENDKAADWLNSKL